MAVDSCIYDPGGQLYDGTFNGVDVSADVSIYGASNTGLNCDSIGGFGCFCDGPGFAGEFEGIILIWLAMEELLLFSLPEAATDTTPLATALLAATAQLCVHGPE